MTAELDLEAIETRYPWMAKAVQVARDFVEAVDPVDAERARARDRERRATHLQGHVLPIEEHVTRQIIDGALERSPAWAAVSKAIAAVQAGHATKKIIGLTGDTGRGKTSSCAGAIAELGGEYVVFDDFVDLWRLAKKNKGERLEVERLLRAKVLALDEVQISSTRIEERVDARLAFHKAIDRRVGVRGITLVCSNRSEQELREAFDDVTFDRLGALCEFVVNEGVSFRQRRPWRVTLAGRSGLWNVPSPIPKLSKEQAAQLRADVLERAGRFRAYYDAKGYSEAELVDVRVELSACVYMALGEIRAAEAP